MQFVNITINLRHGVLNFMYDADSTPFKTSVDRLEFALCTQHHPEIIDKALVFLDHMSGTQVLRLSEIIGYAIHYPDRTTEIDNAWSLYQQQRNRELAKLLADEAEGAKEQRVGIGT